MWNEETARRLATWYASPCGIFALQQEQRLFQRLFSTWPRRGHSLLDVGCGTGVFLEMLWEYGFDVTGIDSVPANLEVSRSRMGQRAELRLGVPDHLPFDDGSMDYVALLSTLEYNKDPEAVLAEAIRVARRGVIVGFMNRWSVNYVCCGFPWPCCRATRKSRWIGFWQLYRMIRRLCPHGRVHTRSVLLGPPATWKHGPLWGRLNSLLMPVPFGAYVGVCIDTQDPIPLTSIPLTTREPQFFAVPGS